MGPARILASSQDGLGAVEGRSWERASGAKLLTSSATPGKLLTLFAPHFPVSTMEVIIVFNS